MKDSRNRIRPNHNGEFGCAVSRDQREDRHTEKRHDILYRIPKRSIRSEKQRLLS